MAENQQTNNGNKKQQPTNAYHNDWATCHNQQHIGADRDLQNILKRQGTQSGSTIADDWVGSEVAIDGGGEVEGCGQELRLGWPGFVMGWTRVTGYCTGDGGDGCSTDENRAKEMVMEVSQGLYGGHRGWWVGRIVMVMWWVAAIDGGSARALRKALL
ncbi:hypothetical protein Acr_00g0056600 [Actinidia rufa]|uniref:Uncharacterized protein n=1 Tax=Actinidia rufa TaxID=165716 RepID=A0A7J0DMD9_9ERIC|nr:hypothetical protein Acr_00g0056600 [Actinidia rufa]